MLVLTHTRVPLRCDAVHAPAQVPPAERGTLYVRPLQMGTGALMGLCPSPTYTFCVFGVPVGSRAKVRPRKGCGGEFWCVGAWDGGARGLWGGWELRPWRVQPRSLHRVSAWWQQGLIVGGEGAPLGWEGQEGCDRILGGRVTSGFCECEAQELTSLPPLLCHAAPCCAQGGKMMGLRYKVEEQLHRAAPRGAGAAKAAGNYSPCLVAQVGTWTSARAAGGSGVEGGVTCGPSRAQRRRRQEAVPQQSFGSRGGLLDMTVDSIDARVLRLMMASLQALVLAHVT